MGLHRSNARIRAAAVLAAIPLLLRVSALNAQVQQPVQPAPADLLREGLLVVTSDVDFRKLVDSQRDAIIKGGFAFGWVKEAAQLLDSFQPEKATRIAEVAAKVAALVEDQHTQAWALLLQGGGTSALHKPAQALALFIQSKPLFETSADTAGMATVLQNIGAANAQLKQHEDALRAFRTALFLRLKIGGRDPSSDQLDDVAETLTSLSEEYVSAGSPDSALANYRSLLALYALKPDRETTIRAATVRRNLARAYASIGDTAAAMVHLDSAALVSRGVADTTGEGNAFDSKAFYLNAQNKHRASAETYERASTLFLGAGEKGLGAGSLEQAGEAWGATGDYQRATTTFLTAIRLYEQVLDTAGIAKCWRAMGDVYWLNTDPKGALEAFERAAGLYERLGDKAGIAETHRDLALVYEGIHEPAKALIHFRQGLAIREQLGDSADVAMALSDIADVYLSSANADSADAYYKRAILEWKSLGDLEQQAVNTLGRFDAIRRLQRDDSAELVLLHEALSLGKQAKSRSVVAVVNAGMGWLALNRGDYGAALAQFDSALHHFHDLGNADAEVTTLLAIAAVQSDMGDNTLARQAMMRALDLAKQGNNQRAIADTYSSIGTLDVAAGDFNGGLKAFQTTLDIDERAGDRRGVADAHLGIGNVYRSDGQFQKALAEFALADTIYRSFGFELLRLPPINNAATIYFFQGEYDAALTRFNEALAILMRAGTQNSMLAVIVSNVGEVYFEQRNYGKARLWLDSAVVVARRVGAKSSLANALTVSGKLALAEGRLSLAKQNLDSALAIANAIGERELTATARAAVGKADYARHDYASAQRNLEQSVREFEAIGSLMIRWQPLYTLGLTYRDLGQPGNAIESLERAVDVIETLRANLAGGEDAKKAFVSADDKAEIFEALIALLIERGEVDDALHYLERSNNDEIREKYKGVMIALSDSANTGAIEQVRRLKARLEAADRKIAKARAMRQPNQRQVRVLDDARLRAAADLREFVRNLARSQPELMRQVARTIPEDELDGLLSEVVEAGKSDTSLQRTAAKTRGLRGKRDAFPAEVALVAFMPGERQLYIFVASRDTVVAKVIAVGRAELTTRVHALLGSLSAPGAAASRGVDGGSGAAAGGDFRSLGESLYGTLIKPLSGLLRGKTRIAFLPSGPLQYLPFQVLGEKQADGHYRFIVEDYTISYVLESATVADTVAPPAIHPRIAAFANADGTLKNAETEVQDIKAVYADAKVYIGTEAKRATAMELSGEYNVLHFATHGTLDYTRPLESFLALARSGTDDGRLMLSSVGKMANSRKRVMVVLSACNTAVAQEKVAGWPVSPALAFLDNGTKTVIASLWKVDDAATALLMQSFYSNLATMGRGLALRHAQESLIRNPKYAHPYYWGAFVLIGEAR